MASLLVQIGATNAVLGLAAGLLVLLVTRFWRNPHLAALLWLLVLVKFVVPPVVPLSVNVPGERRSTESAEDIRPETPPAFSETAQQPRLDDVAASPTVPRSERFASRALPVPPAEATSSSPISIPSTPPTPSRWAVFKTWVSAHGSLSDLLWIWLGGAFVAASLLAIRARQFDRIIAGRAAKEPAVELQAAFDALCRRMQIRRVPQLRIVDAPISPLIWTWLGRTVVLLPQLLVDKFSLEQLTLVLAHEIAHIRRRDHHLRWLEATVQSAYWWLPPVRWIRHRLHDAQEACCDARVVAEFPDRQADYCDALLATADWIARVRRPPILASELGRGPSLKRRIEALLERSPASPLSWMSRGVCALVGCLLLGLTVRFVAAEEPKRQPAERPAEQPAEQPAEFTTKLLVLDQSGRPIPSGQAKISGAIRHGQRIRQMVAIQDGKALVTLKSHRILTMTVELNCPGHMTFHQQFRSKGAEPSLDVAHQYEFRLTPGIKIGGRVVDQSGQPVVGARVFAECPQDKKIEDGANDFDRSTTTNADGRWEISGAPADLNKLELRLRHAADVNEETVVAVTANQHVDLKALKEVLTLPSTPSLSGIVVDPQGKPVVGAMILMNGRDFYRDYGQDNIPKTNASGAFTIAGVAGGTQLLTVFSLDWALKTVAVSVPRRTPLRIALQKGERVEFRTVDPDGKPIADIRFYPQRPRDQKFAGDPQANYLYVLDFLGHRQLLKNQSDKRGVFVWENAPSEALGYQIAHASVLSQPGGDYGPSGSPHTLVFRRRIPVSARVIDGATGAPIHGFSVYEGTHFKVNRPGVWHWSLNPRTEFDPSGFVDSLKTLDRVIRYRVQAKGYRPHVSQPLDAEQASNEPVSLEFRLKKDAGFDGVVQIPDGQPANGAQVYTQTKGSGDFFGLVITDGVGQPTRATRVTTTTADGTFRLEPREEPFVCFISHPSGYAQLTDLELFDSPHLKLTPWGSIQGDLTLNGKPAETIRLRLRDFFPDHSAMPAITQMNVIKTDAAGKYHFDRCIAGRWDEEIVRDPSGAQNNERCVERLAVDVAPGQTVVQSFGQTQPDLIGHVNLPKGVNIDPKATFVFLSRSEVEDPRGQSSNVPLEFRRFNRRWDFYRLQHESAFRFYSLEVGEYELALQVHVQGDQFLHPSFSKKITITPAMFQGKSAEHPIDLGTINLDAASH